MKLKAKIKKEEHSQLPEAVQALYTEDGDNFVLEVDGMVSKTKLDEFRDNNINLKQELSKIKDKYGNIDPEKYNELMELDRKQREKELIDAGKIEELVEERVSNMRKEYETKIDELSNSKETLTSQLSTLSIDNEVQRAAVAAGAQPHAIDDIINRTRSVFSLDEKGQVIGKEGDKVLYGKDGSNPLTIGEYVESLGEKAPHLFKESSGGGNRNEGGARSGSIGRDQIGSNLEAVAKGEVKVQR